MDSIADEQIHHVKSERKKGSCDLERGHFLLLEALDEDEAGHADEAVELYMEAITVCIKAKKETEDKDLAAKLTKVAECALDRAEKLKGIAAKTAEAPKTKTASTMAATRVVPPLGIEGLSLREAPAAASIFAEPSNGGKPSSGGAGYTEEEKRVLATTSLINGREYLPFMDSVDLRERFEINCHFFSQNILTY